MNIEEARLLHKTVLRGVKGLTKEQVAACRAKGGICDGERATTVAGEKAVAEPPLQTKGDQAQE